MPNTAAEQTKRSQGARGLIDACRLSDAADDLLAALKLALPYVQNIAGTKPTGPDGPQRQACRDVDAIKAAIAKAKG